MLAYTAIQSHTYKPLTNFLFCTSHQLPPVASRAGKVEPEGTKLVSPYIHTLVPLTYGDMTWGVSHNTCMPASLSVFDVVLDGSVSVVWGTCAMAGSGTDSCSSPSRIHQYRKLDRRPTVSWCQDTTPSSWYCLWEIHHLLPWAMANYLVISYTPTVVDDCLLPTVICMYVL